jgi:CRP/FNR family transcriptional regulator, cyclic AMP receptor protein
VSVSAEAWGRLLSAGSVRFYEPGAVLLRQGEQATHVLALVAGRVKASRTVRDGSVLVLAVRGPGEILGEIAVLGGEGRSATIVAVDRCETRIIRADRFLLLVRSLGLESQLLRHAMARIREAEAWRAELAALPAGARLIRTLLRLAVPGVVSLDSSGS